MTPPQLTLVQNIWVGKRYTLPQPWNGAIDGDGVWPVMGNGVDGKDTGAWQSDPAPTVQCTWRTVATDIGYTINQGQAAEGQRAHADIQAMTGHDVVFQTSGCGAWHLVG